MKRLLRFAGWLLIFGLAWLGVGWLPMAGKVILLIAALTIVAWDLSGKKSAEP